MKNKKQFLNLIGLLLALALTFGVIGSVQAAQKNDAITKTLVYQKPLDISLGRGGFYIPSSYYSGRAVLARIEPVNTHNLRFTQRWSDLHLYDTSGKEIKNVYGFVYAYFNLNAEDYSAWKKDKLSIYHYDQSKKVWEVCNTQWISGSTNAKYGRVACLVTQEFGLFGLAIER
ncbi:MAG: hypothetical protein GWN00_18770 [Aliifodinibius sp.]|nr:hypothetical protein [candidate division Zixibacteria bacterium]NIT58192.1 hypothetical protein [Fodinibius sp.]NIW45742.1 hypothetical protein [Gammaproteobacteria bacterium]NIR64896.1 hypothetical protein [candidate division Zixibacteria bacterium]NIS46706.1 hypothetical protein [candidate division Zixibacteria bacterium]